MRVDHAVLALLRTHGAADAEAAARMALGVKPPGTRAVQRALAAALRAGLARKGVDAHATVVALLLF